MPKNKSLEKRPEGRFPNPWCSSSVTTGLGASLGALLSPALAGWRYPLQDEKAALQRGSHRWNYSSHETLINLSACMLRKAPFIFKKLKQKHLNRYLSNHTLTLDTSEASLAVISATWCLLLPSCTAFWAGLVPQHVCPGFSYPKQQ